MFTGLIETTGEVRRLDRAGEGARVEVAASFPDRGDLTRLGDSIAIDGVCLTVVAVRAAGEGHVLTFEASHETLARTTLGARTPGDLVNIERALRLGDRLGGHMVAGHVDGVGRIEHITTRGSTWDLQFQMPAELAPEVVEKGSIAIDGISLTVNSVSAEAFGVTIIPHTGSSTTLVRKREGAAVNLETDIIGKYVLRAVSLRGAAPSRGGLTLEALREAGFLG